MRVLPLLALVTAALAEIRVAPKSDLVTPTPAAASHPPSVSRSRGGEQQSVATAQATRGWARLLRRHSKEPILLLLAALLGLSSGIPNPRHSLPWAAPRVQMAPNWLGFHKM